MLEPMNRITPGDWWDIIDHLHPGEPVAMTTTEIDALWPDSKHTHRKRLPTIGSLRPYPRLTRSEHPVIEIDRWDTP